MGCGSEPHGDQRFAKGLVRGSRIATVRIWGGLLHRSRRRTEGAVMLVRSAPEREREWRPYKPHAMRFPMQDPAECKLRTKLGQSSDSRVLGV